MGGHRPEKRKERKRIKTLRKGLIASVTGGRKKEMRALTPLRFIIARNGRVGIFTAQRTTHQTSCQVGNMTLPLSKKYSKTPYQKHSSYK